MDRLAADRSGRGDAELVASALRGELTAFDELVRRYQRQATAVAYRLLSNRDDAMEVVQDAFLASYEKLGTLTRQGRFKSWLLRIVSNLALNRRRGRAIRRMAPLDAPAETDRAGGRPDRPDPHSTTGEQQTSAGELRELMDETIDRMPPTQARALLLFVRAGMSQKQVAEILDCSVEAVKWHVFAARKKLKEALKDYL